MEGHPKRKSIRLTGYDYASNDAYFITICSDEKRCIFGQIPVGANCVRPIPVLSDIGRIIETELLTIPRVYDSVNIDKYVIMPNHIHILLSIRYTDGRTQFAPTVSRIMKQFKGIVTKRLGVSIWQKSFYDHVIRDEKDYLSKWQYMDNNPAKWLEDVNYADF